MTFVLNSLKDAPVGLFLMDDTSPVQDYSPYNRTATISGGTPVQHASLVKGAAWAPVLTSAITTAFPNVVFLQGYESVPFSLEAWGRVVDSAGNSAQQILGNSGQMDGLSINGTVVTFATKYTANGTAACTYDLQEDQTFYAVGVHTENKNSLYVNGELVSEIVLTELQQADTYLSTSSNLISGTTSGSQKLAVNAIGYYAKALDGDTIKRHYQYGTELPTIDNVIALNTGDYFQFSINNTQFFMDKTFATEDDWNLGFFDNTAVVRDRLVPTFTGSVSNAGVWNKSVNIETSGLTSIYGVQFDWDGNGAVVQCSLDGTSWETVVRGKNVTTIPAATNPTNQVLQLRVTFPGGITDDTSYMDNLTVVGLTSAVSNTMAGRTATYTGASPKREFPPLRYHDHWGVDIPAGATVVVSADTLTATVARTIGIWIKRQGVNPTLSMTGGTTYQNGAVATATLVDGQWTLMHVVAAADVTGAITITGPCIVGGLAIYDTALSAGTIASIYAEYVGTDAPRWQDASIIGVSESLTAVTIYAHDWAIEAAG